MENKAVSAEEKKPERRSRITKTMAWYKIMFTPM
jgi:hypothetical protein